MSNMARVVGGVAVDVTSAEDVETRWHGDIVAEFVDVPDAVQDGWLVSSAGAWSAPPRAPLPPAATPPADAFVLNVPDFKMRFTPAELTAIRASSDVTVKAFLAEIVDDPRTVRVNLALPYVQGAITYLAGETDLGAGKLATPLISASRAAQVLAPA